MTNLQGSMLSVQELTSHLGHHSKVLPAHPSSHTPVCSPPNFPLSAGSLLSSQQVEKPVFCFQHPSASSSDGTGCKLIEYRGAQVAAFKVDGRELICLPQAFDLFLKNLVGGLHTVYTKLKRLDITPIVCNVEQVRILRGLGAIQPGVNRCKLISPREFDVLYDDCTNSSARPGRPPKRSALITPDTLEQLKRSKLNSFTDFYAHNRLIADAKKVLGYGPSAPGHSYLSYIDFKKSALFGSCYSYPPQVTHLPLMPFGYPHGMMNLAMTAATAASGYGLRSIQRDGLHPPPPPPGIRHVPVSDIESPRSVDSCPGAEKRARDFDLGVRLLQADDHNHRGQGQGQDHLESSSSSVDCTEKPLNLEVTKTYRGLHCGNPPDCHSLRGGGGVTPEPRSESQGHRYDPDAEGKRLEVESRGPRGEERPGDKNYDGDIDADSDVDSDVINRNDDDDDDRRSQASDLNRLPSGNDDVIINDADDVGQQCVKSDKSSAIDNAEEEEEEEEEEDEDEEAEVDDDDDDDVASAFSMRLIGPGDESRGPLGGRILPPPPTMPPDQYSIDALLTNIQGLLKMAAENARHRERQAMIEKAILQKRLRKEQETRRVLQEQLNNAMQHIQLQFNTTTSTTDATAMMSPAVRNATSLLKDFEKNGASPEIISDAKVALGHPLEKLGIASVGAEKTIERLMESCIVTGSKPSPMEFIAGKDFRFIHDCDRK